jgi:DNA-binding CsgD family transcriptional regulator
MESMPQRDLEAFLSFLRGIYVHLDLESFAAHIVSTLPKVISSELTSYSEVNPGKGIATWVMEPVPPDFPELVRAFERHVREQPRIHPHGQIGVGETLRVSDFLARSQFQRLRLYDQMHRMIGAEHQMTTDLPTTPPLEIGISLNRGGRDFSERERMLLDMLRPHLAQAHRNAEAATELRTHLDSTKHAVEELDRGVVVLTISGRVQWCTDRARKLVSEYFGPFERADRLPEDLRRWVDYQRTPLSGNGSVPPLPEPLIVDRLGQRLVVRFVADPEENRHLLLLEKQTLPFSAGTLRSLGLTRREAEILVWIARGKTNNEVAALLFISPRTVKKHLEHIYQKLGVESRTEAVSRALEIFGFV